MESIQRITPAVLLTLVFALPAEAGPAQGATVDVFQSIQANALFRDVEQIVCADGSTNTLETDVAVLTDTNTDHPIGQPRTTTVGSSAQVTISNFCNGDFRQASANAIHFDFTQNGLASASLTATYDLVALDGSAFGTLDVALTFTGNGPTNASSNVSVENSGNTVTHVVTTLDFRAATLTGVASLNGTNIIDQQSNSNLEIFRSTTMVTP
jgi:hypothetical protein